MKSSTLIFSIRSHKVDVDSEKSHLFLGVQEVKGKGHRKVKHENRFSSQLLLSLKLIAVVYLEKFGSEL